MDDLSTRTILRLSPGYVTRRLFAVNAIFALFGTIIVVSREVFDHGRLFGFSYLFDLDREANVPQAYSMLLLMSASILCAVMAGQAQTSLKRTRAGWIFLSIAALLVGIEEAMQQHETLGGPVRDALGLTGIGMFHFAWTVPACIMLAVASPVLLRLAFSMSSRARLFAMLGGVVYLTGALGFEFIDGYYSEKFGEQNLIYGLMTVVEEVTEMCGLVIFNYAMLLQLGASRTVFIARFN